MREVWATLSKGTKVTLWCDGLRGSSSNNRKRKQHRSDDSDDDSGAECSSKSRKKTKEEEKDEEVHSTSACLQMYSLHLEGGIYVPPPRRHHIRRL